MTLDDKFYPEDGTLLTKFDNTMIRSAGKLGELYQHMTGKDALTLAKGLYYAGALCTTLAMATALTTDSANPQYRTTNAAIDGVMAIAFMHIGRTKKKSTPLKQRMLDELIGNNPRTAPRLRTAMTVLSAYLLAHVAGRWVALTNGGVEDNPGRDPIDATLYATSFALAQLGDYVSLAQIPKPPKKTVWARAKDTLVDYLTPSPAPQPSYVPTRYQSTTELF